MVIETDLLTFYEWLLVGDSERWPALLWFLVVAATLALAALAIGYLTAAVRHGPMKAGDITYRVVITALKEMFRLSPRRVWALSRLAVQESLRRHVWVTLIVFVLILLFAGWFLDRESDDPVKLYLSFVLTATTYLMLVLALFLSAFSLPADIKNKTIYTIVTKPVRSGEIVLGRIIGFTLLGSVILAIMGLCSYLFVVRALSHTHEMTQNDLEIVKDRGRRGETSRRLYHRHDVTLDGEKPKDGAVYQTDTKLGHWHEVTVLNRDGENEYVVGGPREMFQARVPVYGKLRFQDRTGKDVARGISVGNEWAYRSFIEGGTPAAAIWTFSGVDKEEYPEGLPLELYIRVFRSYKGEIERGILGSIVVKNPKTEKASAIRTFRAKDFGIDEQFIPRALIDTDGNPIDLFEHLVDDEGRVEIRIQCLHRAQYFGMAQADCYLRAPGGRFDVNFVKGYASIWVQMVMVISLGVMFSTFLSGAVAMLATMGSIVLGFFTSFLVGVAMGEIEGGGPIESLIRLVTQKNVTIPLEPGLGTTIVHTVDSMFMFFVKLWAYLLPNFGSYSHVDWVAYGFDIPRALVFENLVACLAYVVGVFVTGYFCLRIREVAK